MASRAGRGVPGNGTLKTHKHQHGSRDAPVTSFSGVEKAHVQTHAQEISQHGQHHEHMVSIGLSPLPSRGRRGSVFRPPACATSQIGSV